MRDISNESAKASYLGDDVRSHINLLMITGFLASGCSSEASRLASDYYEAERELQHLEKAESEKGQLCRYGKIYRFNPDRERAIALAEWDEAVAANVDNVSPDQEAGIRRSMGRQMNLAPSEVDGWKDVLEGRAQASRSEANRYRRPEEPELSSTEKHAACIEAAELRTQVGSLRRALRDQERQLRRVRGY